MNPRVNDNVINERKDAFRIQFQVLLCNVIPKWVPKISKERSALACLSLPHGRIQVSPYEHQDTQHSGNLP